MPERCFLGLSFVLVRKTRVKSTFVFVPSACGDNDGDADDDDDDDLDVLKLLAIFVRTGSAQLMKDHDDDNDDFDACVDVSMFIGNVRVIITSAMLSVQCGYVAPVVRWHSEGHIRADYVGHGHETCSQPHTERRTRNANAVTRLRTTDAR